MLIRLEFFSVVKYILSISVTINYENPDLLRRLTSFNRMLREQNCGFPKSKHNGCNTCLRFSVDASLTSRFASIDVITFIKSNIFFCKSVLLHQWNAKPIRLIPIPVYTLKTLLCFGDVVFWNGRLLAWSFFAGFSRLPTKQINPDQSQQNALGQGNTPWRTQRGKNGRPSLTTGFGFASEWLKNITCALIC